MINSIRDSQNRRNIGRRCMIFEVNCGRLAAPLYWWFRWLITMNSVENVHISSNTVWKEVIATNDTGISLVSNSSTSFANNILSNAECGNDCMETYCTIFCGRWSTKMMRAPTLRDQISWVCNTNLIRIDSMNVYPCVYSQFLVVVN